MTPGCSSTVSGIVEFHPRSFSPDAAQMAVIGEKLGK